MGTPDRWVPIPHRTADFAPSSFFPIDHEKLNGLTLSFSVTMMRFYELRDSTTIFDRRVPDVACPINEFSISAMESEHSDRRHKHPLKVRSIADLAHETPHRWEETYLTTMMMLKAMTPTNTIPQSQRPRMKLPIPSRAQSTAIIANRAPTMF